MSTRLFDRDFYRSSGKANWSALILCEAALIFVAALGAALTFLVDRFLFHLVVIMPLFAGFALGVLGQSAGARCLKQGHAHIITITRTGGEILGTRDLADDGIEPWIFRGAEFWRNSQVSRGLIPIRPQTPDDDDLPVLSTWGGDVPRLIAESRIVRSKG